VAARYLVALKQTVDKLARQPGLGHPRAFHHQSLSGMRSYRVEQPFNKHLGFYRHDETTLFLERVMHGSRDLPYRLLRPLGEDDEDVHQRGLPLLLPKAVPGGPDFLADLALLRR